MKKDSSKKGGGDNMYTKLIRKLLTRVAYGNGHCVPTSPSPTSPSPTSPSPMGHCY